MLKIASDDTGALMPSPWLSLGDIIFNFVACNWSLILASAASSLKLCGNCRNSIGSSCNKRPASERKAAYQPITRPPNDWTAIAAYTCCRFGAPPPQAVPGNSYFFRLRRRTACYLNCLVTLGGQGPPQAFRLVECHYRHPSCPISNEWRALFGRRPPSS